MPETAQYSPRPGRRRPFRLLAALLVLLGLAGYFLVQYDSTGGGAPRCTVRAAEGLAGGEGSSYSMTPEQAGYAATIAAVGTAKRMPERAVTIAMATAMQESALRNLDHGDRDSLGLFQQRPSMGWGTADQIRDPVYSAGIFYDRLAEVPGYSRMPLTVAAQKVQKSGFPQAYAKHEPDAILLAAALTGRAPGALTCTGPVPQGPADRARLTARLDRVFGGGAKAGSTAEDDRAVSVALTADGKAGGKTGSTAGGKAGTAAVGRAGADERRGWEVAHWAVAHASELGIEQVSYAGRTWIAGKNKGGWKDTGGTGKPGNAGPRTADSGTVRIFLAR
ncbi:hypothetical protein [Streptomyces sp. NPDC002054]|uniref:hypothetical protein n=1 Tax=Streptomyces sp. NPDC002054 TaxID=3154663 RepID=UPI00331844EB